MEYKWVVKFLRELCYGPDPVKQDVPTLVLAVPLPKEVAPVFLVAPPREVEVVLETLEAGEVSKVVVKAAVKKPVGKSKSKKVRGRI